MDYFEEFFGERGRNAAAAAAAAADSQTGVVGRDDDVALECHDVGAGLLVPEVADVRGRAFGEDAGGAMGPADDGQAGGIAEVARELWPQNVG